MTGFLDRDSAQHRPIASIGRMRVTFLRHNPNACPRPRRHRRLRPIGVCRPLRCVPSSSRTARLFQESGAVRRDVPWVPHTEIAPCSPLVSIITTQLPNEATGATATAASPSPDASRPPSKRHIAVMNATCSTQRRSSFPNRGSATMPSSSSFGPDSCHPAAPAFPVPWPQYRQPPAWGRLCRMSGMPVRKIALSRCSE